MRRRLHRGLILLAGITLISGSEARAGASIRAPLSYRSWNLSDSTDAPSLSQWVTPLQINVPVSASIDLLVRAAAQTVSLDSDESIDWTSTTDTQIGVMARLADDRLVVQGSANMPTGPRELGAEDLRLALALSPPFLGYRIRQPGRGMDLGLGIAYAIPLNRALALSVGGGYLVRGGFKPIEGPGKVDPGDEGTVSLGLDSRIGPTLLRLDFTYRVFGTDSGSGSEYEEPPVWGGTLGLYWAGDRWNLDGRALVSRKEEDDLSLSPYPGTYLGGALGIHRTVGERFAVGSSLELIQYRGLEDDAGDRFESLTAGVGPSLEFPLIGKARAESRFLYLFGELDGEAIDGIDLLLTLIVPFTGSGD